MFGRLHLELLARSQIYCCAYYYLRCPYPVDGHVEPRDCFNASLCGCSNAARYRGEALMTVIETLQHARARFKCLADEFEKSDDTASWAMCSTDAEMMDRAIAALSDQAGGWQDILTAPDNHLPVQVYGPYGQLVAFRDVTWTWWPIPAVNPLGYKLTHWQPLPAPPPSSTAGEVG